VAGIGRGEFPGTYTTELRIERTIYVSPDSCKAELAWNGRYPARMNSRTIWLLVALVQVSRFRRTSLHVAPPAA
jgi:hypothetical protein